MDQNHAKKVNCDGGSQLDAAYYPSPYAMTQFGGQNPNDHRDSQCAIHLMDSLHCNTSPLKPVIIF